MTDSSKFRTEEIVGAQNFNFAPEFPKWGIFNPNFSILGTTFFLQQAKIQGVDSPHVTTPLFTMQHN